MQCKLTRVLILHGLAKGLQAMVIHLHQPNFQSECGDIMPGIVLDLASIHFSALIDLATPS